MGRVVRVVLAARSVARVAPVLVVVELDAIRCVVLGPLVPTRSVPMRGGIDSEVVRVHLQPPLPRVRRGLRLLHVPCMRRALGVSLRLGLREDVHRHAVLKLSRLPPAGAGVTALVVHSDRPVVVMIHVVGVVLVAVAVEVIPAEPAVVLMWSRVLDVVGQTSEDTRDFGGKLSYKYLYRQRGRGVSRRRGVLSSTSTPDMHVHSTYHRLVGRAAFSRVGLQQHSHHPLRLLGNLPVR